MRRWDGKRSDGKHRRAQDFTVKGVHGVESGISKKGPSQGIWGTEAPPPSGVHRQSLQKLNKNGKLVCNF